MQKPIKMEREGYRELGSSKQTHSHISSRAKKRSRRLSLSAILLTISRLVLRMAMDDQQVEVTFHCGIEMLDFPKLAAKRISQKYGLDEDAGLVCLSFYNWDEEILCADLELSLDEAFERCGYLKHTSSSTELATCMVCNEVTVTSLYACGHSFCKVCFTGFCEKMIEAKKFLLVCPYNSCNKHLPPQVVDNFLSSELSFDQKMYTLRSFVDSRPDFTWCGNDPCCCLISHPPNCPMGTVINCLLCNSKLRFDANGEAYPYDDYSLTREGLEAAAKKRNRWWLLPRDDHDFAHVDKKLR